MSKQFYNFGKFQIVHSSSNTLSIVCSYEVMSWTLYNVVLDTNFLLQFFNKRVLVFYTLETFVSKLNMSSCLSNRVQQKPINQHYTKLHFLKLNYETFCWTNSDLSSSLPKTIITPKREDKVVKSKHTSPLALTVHSSPWRQ